MVSLSGIDPSVLMEELLDGFDTNQPFCAGFFKEIATGERVLILTSLATGLEYGLVLRPGGVMTDQAVQVLHGSTNCETRPKDRWRAMTLVPDDKGKIRVRPGWGS